MVYILVIISSLRITRNYCFSHSVIVFLLTLLLIFFLSFEKRNLRVPVYFFKHCSVFKMQGLFVVRFEVFPSSLQLFYYTTFLEVCQEVFQNFFQSFFRSLSFAKPLAVFGSRPLFSARCFSLTSAFPYWLLFFQCARCLSVFLALVRQLYYYSTFFAFCQQVLM